MFQFVFCLLALCYGVTAATASSGCTITMPTDIPELEPVILVSNGKGPSALFRPTGEINTLPVGSVLQLSCLGNGNSIISTGQSKIVLECKGQDQWRDSGNTIRKLADLGCNSIPSSSIQQTGQSCSNGQGHIVQPGFQIDAKFYPTFDICYNNVTAKTFYTHHTLNGATIDYNIQLGKRRALTAEGMTLTTNAINQLYIDSNQTKRFESLFGKNQAYISKRTFITPGQLASDADFIMSYEQLAAYYYVNTAPKFKNKLSANNWWSVEYEARRLAGQVYRDLSSYNGYFGKLSLPDSGKKLIPVNLDTAGKIPIPQYFFKVLHDKKSDSAIVFLTYNSPFETSVKEVCPDVCENAGIYNFNSDNYKRGYTYCCTLNDFLKIYKDLPKELSASNLLTSITE